MPKYATIRISIGDKRKLERLAKLMGWSISETLRRAVEIAEKQLL
jgi:phosphoserine phosphatase